MDLGLGGKVALVGGSSSGLGLAVATELAAEGASVVLCARNAGRLAQAAAGIRAASNVDVLEIAADLSDRDAAERVAARAIEAFGRVDILVNNTGGPPAGAFDAHDADTWERAYRLLLESVVTMTRSVVPGMRARRWGRVINITSIAVKQPVDNLILSNSMRAAVTGFARTLANETGPFGVTVNNLIPGFTRTERRVELSDVTARKEGITPEEALNRYTASVPMGRMGEPREFAALAAFLASERAGYITGQSMAVDGGWIRALM